jgi:hypothetical protein
VWLKTSSAWRSRLSTLSVGILTVVAGSQSSWQLQTSSTRSSIRIAATIMSRSHRASGRRAVHCVRLESRPIESTAKVAEHLSPPADPVYLWINSLSRARRWTHSSHLPKNRLVPSAGSTFVLQVDRHFRGIVGKPAPPKANSFDPCFNYLCHTPGVVTRPALDSCRLMLGRDRLLNAREGSLRPVAPIDCLRLRSVWRIRRRGTQRLLFSSHFRVSRLMTSEESPGFRAEHTCPCSD